ncbi:MAG: DivIVA domain-containing protein [Clostridiales bacterium]|nr:DivIVA domain-containing protein [Clostridiales bacterium]MDD7258682.1 DivIVA domain-containing protein [Eubacteriales bacterium]MDY6066937.1 DivIVA domain-containing protein [Candidatus Faecousia sp.]
MITPQQIDQVSFSKASFGGYNMQQVDEFLEPLTEDYVTLYKENALLKSKMRVLAGKLEEYRKSGVEAKNASGEAKAAADKMLLDTKAKCDRMLKEATAKAQAITASAAPAAPAQGSNAETLIAAENARVEEARKAANAKIAEIQEQMRACIQALERIKGAAPAAPAVKPAAPAAPVADAMHYDSGSVADEIAHNVEALVGSTEDTAPKAEPKHPVADTTTSRFANLNLQFGRNYDPTHK